MGLKSAGATRGIGRACALRLEEAGATVVATSRAEVDVRERASVEAAVAAAVERHGRIDALVANAGVNPHFVRPDLSREDGQPLGQAFQSVQWGPAAVPGVQVSRATRQIDPAVDTAALKLLKVIDFINAA